MTSEQTSDSELAQLAKTLQTSDGSDDHADPAAPTASVVADATGQASHDGESVPVDEELVTESLSELVMVLVALRERETNGKAIMDDLARFFDARLSPGTVYPTLHELADEDLLDKQELVQTKEYRISDESAVKSRIRDQMHQHLALGLVLQRALEELEPSDAE